MYDATECNTAFNVRDFEPFEIKVVFRKQSDCPVQVQLQFSALTAVAARFTECSG
jgi:hypothetical protein